MAAALREAPHPMAPPLQARSPRSSCGDANEETGELFLLEPLEKHNYGARSPASAPPARICVHWPTAPDSANPATPPNPSADQYSSSTLLSCARRCRARLRCCCRVAAAATAASLRISAFSLRLHAPASWQGQCHSGAVSPIQPSSQAVKQGLKNSICRGCRGPSKGPRWTARGVRKFAGGVGLRPRGYPCQGARRAQLRPARGGQAATG
jgi:hypothetical protein